MQGLADGYFVIPLTIGDYLAGAKLAPVGTEHPEFKRVEAEVNGRISTLLNSKGRRSADSFHRELGKIMWEKCGMARSASGLKEALARIPELWAEFWSDVQVPGTGTALNQSLEQAGRVADFLELGELMCRDALEREESCGGHFRVEHQTDDGEAKRDDSRFCYAAAWEWAGEGAPQRLTREPLAFENVTLSARSYK
jgi:succinate dehydrogenase / fumarate reductase flavoprotein subunit